MQSRHVSQVVLQILSEVRQLERMTFRYCRLNLLPQKHVYHGVQQGVAVQSVTFVRCQMVARHEVVAATHADTVDVFRRVFVMFPPYFHEHPALGLPVMITAVFHAEVFHDCPGFSHLFFFGALLLGMYGGERLVDVLPGTRCRTIMKAFPKELPAIHFLNTLHE
jgi:hypothetical protein